MWFKGFHIFSLSMDSHIYTFHALVAQFRTKFGDLHYFLYIEVIQSIERIPSLEQICPYNFYKMLCSKTTFLSVCICVKISTFYSLRLHEHECMCQNSKLARGDQLSKVKKTNIGIH